MHGAHPLSPELLAQVGEALGHPVTLVHGVAGGDINHAALLEGPQGTIFLKWNEAQLPGLFSCEEEGLAALRDAHALKVPRVLGLRDPESGRPGFLALEYVVAGRQDGAWFEALGRGLAELHRIRARRFGFHQDNYLGSLKQDNGWSDSWVEFLVERRLAPLARLAELGPSVRGRLDRLLARLGQYVPAHPTASRLHGDLWAGNVLAGSQGEPVLIDPAVVHGHREVDLAMSELFGGFSPRFHAAYREAWPLEPGYERRRDVYQLLPLLVHVILFGRSYEAQVDSRLRRLS